MAQHDYSIANQSGSAFRADLNTALSAIVTQNSGTSSPATTFAHQMWADTTNNVMKLRNAANSGWIELYQLDGEWTDIAFENGTAAAPSIYFKDSGTDTGFYSPGANQVGISTGGTSALVVDASQRVGLGSSSPSSLLHLQTTSANVVLQMLENNGSTVYGASLDAFNSSGGNFRIRLHDSGGTYQERFRITSTGNVGIGTTSPSQNLHIYQATDNDVGIRIQNNDGFAELEVDADELNYNADSHVFNNQADTTEFARIDGSGRLLVGTSSARSVGGLTNQVQIEGANAGTYSQSWVRNVAGSGGATIYLGKSRSGSPGGVTIVNSADQLGGIYWCGADGVDLDTPGASIEAYVDGTPGANDMPGRLAFSTTADGASSPTERMRINSSGAVEIFDNIRPWTDNSTSLGTASKRWSVVYAATGTINTSDANQKQDIEDLDAAELSVATAIKGLIKKFRFIDSVADKGDDARIHVGVIAQEVEQAFVAASLDPRRYGMFCEDVLEDGTKRLGIRYDELLAFVIAAL